MLQMDKQRQNNYDNNEQVVGHNVPAMILINILIKTLLINVIELSTETLTANRGDLYC